MNERVCEETGGMGGWKKEYVSERWVEEGVIDRTGEDDGIGEAVAVHDDVMIDMETFRITGPLWWKSTDDWIPYKGPVVMSFVVGDLKTVEQTVELTVIEDAMPCGVTVIMSDWAKELQKQGWNERTGELMEEKYDIFD